MPQDQIITPGGARAGSLVHEIEPGNVVHMELGRMVERRRDGLVITDFGTIGTRFARQPLMPLNVSLPERIAPVLGSGWITYASWRNRTAKPVTLFRSTWIVPPQPATNSGQLIYLFNGIQNSTMIFQPVLQWGNNGKFGGPYWVVASWYADGKLGQAFHSPPVPVDVGKNLVGIITVTGRIGGKFSYESHFQGIPGSVLDIVDQPELVWLVETLEAYNVSRCSDYPNTDLLSSPKSQSRLMATDQP